MRKALSILVLAVMAASVLLATAIAAPVHSPHEDPDAAKSDFDVALPILLHYADVLSLLAEGKYEDTRDLIEQLDLDRATIPDDVRFVAQTYNGLLSDLTASLDSLEAALDELELLLEEGDINACRLRITEARQLAEEARDRLEDVDEATSQLGEILGPFAASAEVDIVEEAKSRLWGAKDRLSELEALYEAALESFETELEEAEKELPEETGLTLQLDRQQAWVGDTVAASGMLTSAEGAALAGRTIRLLLDSHVVAAVTTDDAGLYGGAVDIPYLYVDSMRAEAKYVPTGDDEGEYQPCLSNPVDVAVSFYQTTLEVEVPKPAFPGLPLEIRGQITREGGNGPDEARIELLWDDELVSSYALSQDTFQVELTPDPQTALGEHGLTVVLQPHDRYSGALADTVVTIVQGLPEISLDNLSFDTLTRKLRIAGHLYSDLPVQAANVSITLAGTSTVVSTSAEGEFEASLSLPLGSTIVGKQTVEVTVEPLEPWHLPVTMETQVFVMDIVNLVLMSAALVSVGVVLYARTKGKSGATGVELEGEMTPSQTGTQALPVQPGKAETAKARILASYAEAAGIVERKTGVSSQPSTTLREFLKQALPELRKASQAFAELTRLSEESLYSPHAPGEDKAVRAERLLESLREVAANDAA